MERFMHLWSMKQKKLLRKLTLGRKARKGSEFEKCSHAQLPVPAKEENKNHSNEQHDAAADNEVGEHTSQEKNKRKGRKRSKGKKYHVNHTTVHGNVGIGEPSRPPPGPRMPDGTRGFTMGRGRRLVCDHSS